jgi:hypothetical protein
LVEYANYLGGAGPVSSLRTNVRRALDWKIETADILGSRAWTAQATSTLDRKLYFGGLPYNSAAAEGPAAAPSSAVTLATMLSYRNARRRRT